MKRIMVCALCIALFTSLFACGSRSAETPEQNVEPLQTENAVKLPEIDWETVFSEMPELNDWKISAGNGRIFCGCDMSSPGSEKIFSHIHADGSRIDSVSVLNSENFKGTVMAAGCYDGELYELINVDGAKIILLKVENGLVTVSWELDPPKDGAQMSIITDGGLIIAEKLESNSGGVLRSEYTAWELVDGSFKEIIHEISEDDRRKHESVGLRILDCGIVDGTVTALGEGRRDDVYEYRLCKYSESGMPQSSEIVRTSGRQLDVDLGTYFMTDSEIRDVGSVFCRNEDYSAAVSPDGRAVVYDRAAKRGMAFEFEPDGDFRLSGIISTGDGFVGEFTNAAGEIRHSGVILSEDIRAIAEEMGVE